jgi:translation elongation factor EF-Tu-like GTPase
MKKIAIVGTVGHIDHGKTTLTAAIKEAMREEIDPSSIKSGQELRRERRKNKSKRS